jgi:hypothetical protein
MDDIAQANRDAAAQEKRAAAEAKNKLLEAVWHPVAAIAEVVATCCETCGKVRESDAQTYVRFRQQSRNGGVRMMATPMQLIPPHLPRSISVQHAREAYCPACVRKQFVDKSEGF